MFTHLKRIVWFDSSVGFFFPYMTIGWPITGSQIFLDITQNKTAILFLLFTEMLKCTHKNDAECLMFFTYVSQNAKQTISLFFSRKKNLCARRSFTRPTQYVNSLWSKHIHTFYILFQIMWAKDLFVYRFVLIGPSHRRWYTDTKIYNNKKTCFQTDFDTIF